MMLFFIVCFHQTKFQIEHVTKMAFYRDKIEMQGPIFRDLPESERSVSYRITTQKTADYFTMSICLRAENCQNIIIKCDHLFSRLRICLSMYSPLLKTTTCK